MTRSTDAEADDGVRAVLRRHLETLARGTARATRLRAFGVLILVAMSFRLAGAPARGVEIEAFRVLPHRVETTHYTVIGTAPPPILNRLGTDMDFIYEAYDSEFRDVLVEDSNQVSRDKKQARRRSHRRRSTRQGKPTDRRAEPSAVAPEPEGGKHRIVVFATRGQFDAWRAQYLPEVKPWANAFYVQSLRALVGHLDGGLDEAYPSFFHEGFHQFLRRYIPNAPIWLDEGLAEHYAQARLAPSGWVFPPHEGRFRASAELFQARRLTPLDQLLFMDQKAFYGGNTVGPTAAHIAGENYSAAYTLVYVILQNPQAKERLRAYLRALARNASPNHRAITNEHFPPRYRAALQEEWARAVVRF